MVVSLVAHVEDGIWGAGELITLGLPGLLLLQLAPVCVVSDWSPANEDFLCCFTDDPFFCVMDEVEEEEEVLPVGDDVSFLLDFLCFELRDAATWDEEGGYKYPSPPKGATFLCCEEPPSPTISEGGPMDGFDAGGRTRDFEISTSSLEFFKERSSALSPRNSCFDIHRLSG